MRQNIPTTCLGCHYLRRKSVLGGQATAYVCEHPQLRRTLGVNISDPRPPDGQVCYKSMEVPGFKGPKTQRLIEQFYACGEILADAQGRFLVEQLRQARLLLDQSRLRVCDEEWRGRIDRFLSETEEGS